MLTGAGGGGGVDECSRVLVSVCVEPSCCTVSVRCVSVVRVPSSRVVDVCVRVVVVDTGLVAHPPIPKPNAAINSQELVRSFIVDVNARTSPDDDAAGMARGAAARSRLGVPASVGDDETRALRNTLRSLARRSSRLRRFTYAVQNS